MRPRLLEASAALGTAAYCLVLLASKDAPAFPAALSGVASLSVACISLGLLWRFPRDAEDVAA